MTATRSLQWQPCICLLTWPGSTLSPLFLISQMRTQLFPLGTLDQTNQKFGLNLSNEKVPKFGNATTLLSTLNWPPLLGAHLDYDWWKYCHFFLSHVFLSKWATFSPWLNQLGVCTSDFSCMSSLLTRILAKTLSLYLFARNGNILAKISHSVEGGWVRGYSWHQCHHGQNKQSLALNFSWDDVEKWKAVQSFSDTFIWGHLANKSLLWENGTL